MKKFTYKQTLIIGIVIAAIGYPLSNVSAIGEFMIVIGDTVIVVSIVMLFKKRRRPSDK